MVRVALMVVSAAALAGCSNWVPAEAMVTSIDRKCMIVEKTTVGTHTSASGKERPVTEQRTYEGRCDEVDNWAEEKAKRSMTIDGKAAIHLSYTGQDGKTRSGVIHVTGRDPQFYDVTVGGMVPIRFDADNPQRLAFS